MAAPALEGVAMRFVIQALVAMALVAGFGPGPAWSAKDDGKKGFGQENLLGDALAVYEAEHVLSAGVALLGKWSKLAQRRRISPARSQK